MIKKFEPDSIPRGNFPLSMEFISPKELDEALKISIRLYSSNFYQTDYVLGSEPFKCVSQILKGDENKK